MKALKVVFAVECPVGIDLVAAVRADDESPVLVRALGLLARWPVGRLAVRGAGGVIALVGLAYLTGLT